MVTPAASWRIPSLKLSESTATTGAVREIEIEIVQQRHSTLSRRGACTTPKRRRHIMKTATAAVHGAGVTAGHQ